MKTIILMCLIGIALPVDAAPSRRACCVRPPTVVRSHIVKPGRPIIVHARRN
jgi:hypothetical protein